MEIAIHAPPRSILFATDLTVRCDRALSRATLLAKSWDARLVTVHAVEPWDDASGEVLDRPLPPWHATPDPLRDTKERVRREVMQATPNGVVFVEQGTPIEVIAHATEAEKCDLIVTGIGRDETLTRLGLRRTIDRLVTRLGIPLLTVRQKADGPYRNVLVAIDLSDASQRALQTAAAFFPAQPLSILHAHDLTLSEGAAARHTDRYQEDAMEKCAVFVTDAIGPGTPQRGLELFVKRGWPSDVIRQHTLRHKIDLVVVGAHDRGALFELLFGSTATDILTSLPCDVLIVGRGAPS